jgi:cellulase/cellobiase CelA1
VNYTLLRQWHQGFLGEFTIVNKGSVTINGWELAAELPGDQVEAAWLAGFHVSGDTLILDPRSEQMTIDPGASLTEYFTASGSATSPTSCTFNGQPC